MITCSSHEINSEELSRIKECKNIQLKEFENLFSELDKAANQEKKDEIDATYLTISKMFKDNEKPESIKKFISEKLHKNSIAKRASRHRRENRKDSPIPVLIRKRALKIGKEYPYRIQSKMMNAILVISLLESNLVTQLTRRERSRLDSLIQATQNKLLNISRTPSPCKSSLNSIMSAYGSQSRNVRFKEFEGGKDMHERKIDEVEDLISYRSGVRCVTPVKRSSRCNGIHHQQRSNKFNNERFHESISSFPFNCHEGCLENIPHETTLDLLAAMGYQKLKLIADSNESSKESNESYIKKYFKTILLIVFFLSLMYLFAIGWNYHQSYSIQEKEYISKISNLENENFAIKIELNSTTLKLSDAISEVRKCEENLKAAKIDIDSLSTTMNLHIEEIIRNFTHSK